MIRGRGSKARMWVSQLAIFQPSEPEKHLLLLVFDLVDLTGKRISSSKKLMREMVLVT